VNFVLSFQSGLQISFRIIVIRIYSWHEIEFTCFYVLFDCFFVAKTRCFFELIFCDNFANLRFISIKQTFSLCVRIKSEFWAYLILSSSLTHSPIHMLRFRRHVVYRWYSLHSFLHSLLVRSESSKMHHSRTFALGSILKVWFKSGNQSIWTH